MSRIHFDTLPEFEQDLKYLLKKYRTLNEDLEIVMQVLNDRPIFL